MHYGFKIIDDLVDGLSNWLDEKGHAALGGMVGRALPNVTDWQYLNLNYKTVARIDQESCIKCGLCHIACEDTSHQAISASSDGGGRRYEVIDRECVGCNLCLFACPVTDCISMVEVPTGRKAINWLQHPNNPLREPAE
jgi:dihydropyrimidine dehydrogenase (NAD+) subunit PreA